MINIICLFIYTVYEIGLKKWKLNQIYKQTKKLCNIQDIYVSGKVGINCDKHSLNFTEDANK